MTNREHAWNTVFINKVWKLIDPTWASGYTNSEVTEFKKTYSEFYFFTNPIEFFNDHYPTDNKWSLLPVTPTLTQFYNFPFYYPTFYQFRVIH
jgi:transglutaminase/protease-like cytokinesis protein 3